MKWVDYREQLGIGFNDNQKFIMLKSRIITFINLVRKEKCYSESAFNQYLFMVGEIQTDYDQYSSLINSLINTNTTNELISKYIAFSNTFSAVDIYGYPSNKYTSDSMFTFLKNSLYSLNIAYDVIKDDDGYFIFPKGAKELDDALVSAPLNWLKAYPKAHKAFVKALKSYSEATDANASDIADLFRKALETFFQEFFNETKSLENMLSIYGNYLKDKGVPAEIANNFQKLLEQYSLYNNNFAKHHDKTSKSVLEYILYQTGNTIRLLITLKESNKDAD